MKMDARISLVIGLFLLAESAYTQPANQNHPTLRGLTSLVSLKFHSSKQSDSILIQFFFVSNESFSIFFHPILAFAIC